MEINSKLFPIKIKVIQQLVLIDALIKSATLVRARSNLDVISQYSIKIQQTDANTTHYSRLCKNQFNIFNFNFIFLFGFVIFVYFFKLIC